MGTRRGGAGEFTALAGVASWPGDSIVAWDSRSHAIAVFDAGGALGRTFELEAEGRPAEPRQAMPGSEVLGRTAGSRTAMGYRRETYTYALHDAEGNRRVSLGDHPGSESFVSMEGRIAVFGNVPFSRSLHEETWDGSVVLAPDDSYEVRVHDPTTGALQRIVRRDYAKRAPTREEVD